MKAGKDNEGPWWLFSWRLVERTPPRGRVLLHQHESSWLGINQFFLRVSLPTNLSTRMAIIVRMSLMSYNLLQMKAFVICLLKYKTPMIPPESYPRKLTSYPSSRFHNLWEQYRTLDVWGSVSGITVPKTGPRLHTLWSRSPRLRYLMDLYLHKPRVRG